MSVMYRQQVYTCGDYRQVRYYTVAPVRRQARRRAWTKPTSAAQRWINQRYRQDKLTRLLNANFTPSDYELSLTYQPGCQPDAAEGVVRDVQNYIRRVRYAYEKAALPAPLYIWVPEGDGVETRYHVHITITGGLKRSTLEGLWGSVVKAPEKDVGSIAFSKELRFDKYGCESLARYLLKESREELDQLTVDPDTGEIYAPQGSPFKKAYYCSRGLVDPEPEVKTVSQGAVVEMCTVDAGARKPLEDRFPGWVMADAQPHYDEQYGRWYLYATLYRQGSFMSRVRGDEIARQRKRRAVAKVDEDDLPW